MIWREKSTLLTVLGIALLANVIFFFTYRVQYQSRIEALDTRLADTKGELERARNSRVRTERTFQAYRQVEKDVENIYDQHWSTQPKRLTLLIAEVKRLAAASNLAPPQYSFNLSQAKTENAGARKNKSLGASEVGIAFVVQGSYPDVRKLINLLELSRQFVIIDSIGISEADDNKLTLNLQLKTLFRDEAADGAAQSL
jgi:Tfp pilus assembly protein PilO